MVFGRQSIAGRPATGPVSRSGGWLMACCKRTLSKSLRLVVLSLLVCGMMLVGASRADDSIGQRAVRLYEQGKYREALAEAKVAEAESKARIGEESKPHALALSYIGLVLKAQGRYEEAETHLKRALEIR